MISDVAKLQIRVDTLEVDAARRRLDGLNRSGGRAEKSFIGMRARALAAGAAIAGVTAAAAGFVAVTRIASKFEDSMAGVRAVTRATAEEMDAMEKQARKLGATTIFSASEAAEGMRFLGQAGFETNEIISAMPGLLDLAAASGMDLGEAADIASNIMSGFNLDAGESSRVADLLAGAASSANTNVSQLGQGMKFVAPIASALGISVEETAAALGVLSDAGIQGQMAGTSLRTVIAALTDATPVATREIKGMGIAMEDVDPSANSLEEILSTLAESGLSAGSAVKIFGREGAPAVLALTSQIGRLKQLNNEFKNTEGRAREMADVMSDTLTGDIKELGSAISELALKIDGKAGLTDALREGTKETTNFLQEYSKIADLSEIQKKAINAPETLGQKDLDGLKDLFDLELRRLDNPLFSSEQQEARALRIGQIEGLIRNLEKQAAAEEKATEVANKAAAAQKKAAAAEQERTQQIFTRQQASEQVIADTRAMLATEEELIREANQRQVDLVNEQVIDASKRFELLAGLAAKLQADLAAIGPAEDVDREQPDLERLTEFLMTEEEKILQSYERRKDIILEATFDTEAQRQEMLEKLDDDFRQKMHQREVDRWKSALSTFDDFQDNMLVLAKTGNKQMSDVFKAAAIANTVISTYEGAQNAYTSLSKIPYVGPVLGAAAAGAAIAAGMARVAAIKAQDAGSYQDGGIVGGTSYSGDRMTARVNSGEAILNRAQQNRMFSILNGSEGGGSSPTVNLTVNNNSQARVSTRETRDGGIEITIDEMETTLASRVQRGGSPLPDAIRNSFGLTRQGI